MKVSICCITYNHAKFIVSAVESFLCQKTSFPYEVIISDDCSTDGTRDILLEYQSRYPDVIRLILNDNNIGMIPNFVQALKACKGKYVALCEGDDYWLSSDKLQRQFEFLEQNYHYALCFHPCIVDNIETNSKNITNISDEEKSFDLHEIVQREWFIMTCSIFFRRESLQLPDWYSRVLSGDYALQLLLATSGRFYCLPQTMAVYRKHPHGVSQTLFNWKFVTVTLCKLLDTFNSHTNNIYCEIINQKKVKLRDRLVDEYAYRMSANNYFSFSYLQDYLNMIRFSVFSISKHRKYAIRYLVPNAIVGFFSRKYSHKKES